MGKPTAPLIQTRAAMMGERASIDEAARTVPAILATENPVRVFDWERGAVVNECLLMSGMHIRGGGDNVVMLDSHDRSTVQKILGRSRNLKIENARLVSLRCFDEDDDSKRAFGKVRSGSLCDGSIGYVVRASQWVEPGVKATIGGREFQGPLKVCTDWELIEDSVTPIGADPDAVMREYAAAGSAEQKGGHMDPEVRKILEARGLKAGATDEEARAFLATLAVPQSAPDGVAEVRAAEKMRIDSIRKHGEVCGNRDLAERMIAEGVAEPDAKARMYEDWKARKAAEAGAQPSKGAKRNPADDPSWLVTAIRSL